MSRFTEGLDVLFGGSGRRRDDGYNPFRNKADVGPAPNVVRIKPKPPAEPNPFDDADPADGATQPDSTVPAPPSAPADAQDGAQEKPDNPYQRRADSTQPQPEAAAGQLDAELQQLFRGYAMRWRRRLDNARDSRPNVFYDVLDLRGYYTYENPDKTDAEVSQLIARDIESGRLAVVPMMLDFGGEPIEELSSDHPIAVALWQQYRKATGEDQPDSPAPDPQPDATTAPPAPDSVPAPQPAPPTEPTPDSPAETPTPAAGAPAPSGDLGAEVDAIFGPPTGAPARAPAAPPDSPPADVPAPHSEPNPEPAPQPAEPAPAPAPAPAPMPASQPPAIGLEAIIAALPSSERNAFYAQLAREVVSGGGLNAQDLARAMATTPGHTETSAPLEPPHDHQQSPTTP